MGKHTKGGGGTSNIRLIVLEANLSEGDLGPITQAIQNALRPPAPVQRLAAPKPVAINGTTVEPEPEAEVQDADFEEVEESAPAPRPKTTRKVKSAKVVDIDMNKSVSLAEFTKGKDPGSNHKRYMTIATWLKEHRGMDAITSDHVYTCYKSIGWPSNIKDFAQPLRELKSANLFDQPEKGQYAINHVGVDKVRAFLA